jgi:hypothetical protein
VQHWLHIQEEMEALSREIDYETMSWDAEKK